MLNILDYLFIILAATLLISGFLVNYYEDLTPNCLLRLWGYGSFSYKGKDLIKWIEVPKSYFRHFYIYACVMCVFMFVYMIYVYYSNVYVFEVINLTLEWLLGDVEPVSVSRAMLTMFLFTTHVTRRLYETLYLQVFAKASKMNLIHYILAFVHYTACILMLVGYAPLFTGCQNKDAIEWTDSNPAVTLPFIALFVFASIEQYRSNIILANTRKDRKGKVVTEEYNIPKGGWFEYVSSPHRFTEVIIYASLCGLQATRTSFLAFLWVFVNQTQIAIKVHKWYLTEFKNYPKDRKAIIPFIL